MSQVSDKLPVDVSDHLQMSSVAGRCSGISNRHDEYNLYMLMRKTPEEMGRIDTLKGFIQCFRNAKNRFGGNTLLL